LALMLGSLSPATALTELSIFDWWNTDGDAPWAVTDANDLWADMQPATEVWTLPTYGQAEGLWTLKVEYAGFRTSNKFGWYVPTDAEGPGGPITYHEIFDGSADDNDTGIAYINLPTGLTEFGFYLEGPDTGTGTDGRFHTEAGLDNDVKQDRVFQEVGGSPNLWAICWEDRPADGPAAGYDYDNAWLMDGGTSGRGNPLTWAYPEEPDYQDMIVTVEITERDLNTPELPTFLLAALSLAALPVLRRRRRS